MTFHNNMLLSCQTSMHLNANINACVMQTTFVLMNYSYSLTGDIEGFPKCNGVVLCEQIMPAENADLLDDNKPAPLVGFVDGSSQTSEKASSTSSEVDKGNAASL